MKLYERYIRFVINVTTTILDEQMTNRKVLLLKAKNIWNEGQGNPFMDLSKRPDSGTLNSTN
jgi:hypothetical protein